jgi:hypothetical protein
MAFVPKTVNLVYTGAAVNFVIPNDCGDQLTIVANGAGGPFTGDGAGGKVIGDLAITEADKGVTNLRIRIGGVGGSPSATIGGAAGFNGGGTGGNNTGGGSPGYGGSGATDVRLGGDALANRIIVAAGAGATGRTGATGVKGSGGAGGAATGAAGGSATGGNPSTGGGGGGTQTAGGAAGAPNGTTSSLGQAGSLGQGGNGGGSASSVVRGGGAGGGGYWGGGSAANASSDHSSGAGGGGSNFFDPVKIPDGTTTRGTGAAQGNNGTLSFLYLPTPRAPIIGNFTALDPEAILRTPAGGGWLLNPDYPVKISWTYESDLPNGADHWKSRLTYSTDNVTWLPMENMDSEVAIYTASAFSVITVTIPAGNFESGHLYYLRIQDMNVMTEQWGVPAVIQFNTPARPATPVWTSPALALDGSGNPVFTQEDDLPIRVTWTAVSQVKYRIAQIAWPNGNPDEPLWDTGWCNSSIRAALIDPSNYEIDCLLLLWIHNGSIASDFAETGVHIPAQPNFTYLKSKPKIELEVYAHDTGEFISNVPSRISPTYLEEHRGPGAGSFTLLLDDATWTANPTLIDPGNIVRVKDGGRYIGFWVISGHTPTIVATDEGSAEGIIVRGLGGYGAWLSQAIVYPERGSQDLRVTPAVVRQKRSFGVASSASLGHWFDTTSWTIPVEIARQDVATGGATNPWAGSPSDWPADLNTAFWIWSFTPDTFPSGEGICVFKTVINNPLAYAQPLKMYLAADDEAQAYLDGDPWVYSNSWQTTSESDIAWVAPGPHSVTIVAAQSAYPQDSPDYSNPAAILCGLYVLSDAGEAAAHTAFAQSNAINYLMLPYPGVLPSWTMGDMLTLLYNEIVSRAAANGQTTVFNLFQLGFDETFDSYGRVWSRDGAQWFFDHGLGYDQVIDKVTDTACDIWFDENLRMQSARTRGVDRGELNPPGDYLTLVQNSEPDELFDFRGAVQTGSIDTVGTVKYFPGLNGELVVIDLNHFVFDPYWRYFASVGAGALMEPPADSLVGLSNSAAAEYPAILSIINVDSLSPGGNLGFDITGEDGFCLEFIINDASWDLGLEMWPAGEDSSVSNSTAVDDAFFFDFGLRDNSFDVFDSDQIFVEINQNGETVHRNIRNDELSHHWVCNFYNVSGQSVVIIYMDGVEVVNTQVATPFTVGQLSLNIQFDNSGTPKDLGGFGYFAFYQRLLSEDEIYSHYDGMQTGHLTKIEPVIFRKGKNVLTSNSTIDFSAKTVLLTKSDTNMAEVVGNVSALDKFGRVEGFYDGSGKNYSNARRIASSTIESSLAAQTSSTIDFWSSYTPWVDFGVSDWILGPGDYGEEYVKRRVMSLAIAEDPDTGESVYTTEIDSLNQEESKRLALWISRTLPQGNLSGLIADQG